VDNINIEKVAKRFGVSINSLDIDKELELTINRINLKRNKNQ